MKKKIRFLQDGWGGSQESWDDTEDNCAPGWPSEEDIKKEHMGRKTH